MKLNMGKCKVLPLGRKSPLQQYRLGAASLGTLVILVGSELNMSLWCATCTTASRVLFTGAQHVD